LSQEYRAFLYGDTTLTASNKPNFEEQAARLDRKVFELQALMKASDALHNELDVKELTSLFMAMVRERSNVQRMAVILHDPDIKAMVVQAQMGLDDGLVGKRFPAEDGILWRLLRAGEPFTVTDISGRSRFPHIFVEHDLEGLDAQLWVPLVMPGRVVGVLSMACAQTEQDVGVFDPDDSFLSALASQATVALHTALLYQSIAVARRELDRSLFQISMLFDVTRAMGAVTDLTELLQIILDRAIDAVDAEKGSLMLLDEETGELAIRVVFGLPDKQVERKINSGEMLCRRFKPGEGIAGRAFMENRTICVDNTAADGAFTERESTNVHSIICVPLNVDDGTIGVLNITNKRALMFAGKPASGEEPGADRSFSKDDQDILGALADQAAIAIARARLYEAAITDSLTGLYVRRFAWHRLKEEIKRVHRYSGRLSIVMCDIDHFKRVNDTWGHAVGDAVLVSVADALRASLRVGIDIAARVGGEEFLLILPDTDLVGAAAAAERLRIYIQKNKVKIDDGDDQMVTMSFGAAQFDLKNGEESEVLVRRADVAMYEAKNAGRNQVSVSPMPSS